MKLKEALILINAIADEGRETYQEAYDSGAVTTAIKIIDNFIDFLDKNT
jgi:hypothetical protein